MLRGESGRYWCVDDERCARSTAVLGRYVHLLDHGDIYSCNFDMVADLDDGA